MQKINWIFLIALFLLSCGQQKKQSGANYNLDKAKNFTDTTIVIKDNKSPHLRTTGTIGNVKVVMEYGSPAVKGREIWGKLVPYSNVWRAGADAATTITFGKDVTIDGEKVKAAKYAIFILPRKEAKWTFIFNKNEEQWGSFDYEKSMDLLRVDVQPQTLNTLQENMRFDVVDSGIVFKWEKVMLFLPVQP